LSAVGRTVGALAFLLALTVGFYRQLTLIPGYTWLENPDQALQVRPWLDYEARELHAGRLPLWDPYQVGGQSLIGQVQPGLANPLNWILFAMPLRAGHIPLNVLHWYWVLIHWAAAAFCFALCRDLGAGVGASILGASVWAFGGFMGHSGTPQFLMSALWIPIILLFFARVFRGQRPRGSAALCGAAMGLAFLGGHHNIPIYTGVMMGGLWLWYLVSGWLATASARQRIIHAGIFAIVCFLVSAVQMLPAIEYGRHAIRWAGAPEPQRWKDKIPYSIHAEYSLRARSIPGLVVPGLTLHANPFVGIVALSLALTAVYLRWRSRRVRLLATVALGALMLALGVDTPLHGIAYLLIPMVEKARYPAMAIVISQAGIAALAALGLHALSHATVIYRRPTAYWLAGFSAAIFAIYGALFLLHRAPIAHPTWIIGAVALVFAVLLYLWPRSTQASVWTLSAAALVLFFVEVSTVPLPIQRQNQPDSLLKPLADVSDIADFLHRQSGWFRMQIDEDAIPANFGDFYGIEQVDGYLASMPVNIHRILGEHEMPRWFGVEFYIGRKPAKPEQIEVFQSRTGIKVYRNPGIEQPLWTEHDSPCTSGDHVQVIERTPGAMTIDADLKCDGRVVAGDPWFQGWRAQIDGKRVRIQEYAGVIRAVPVAAGKHRIEFQYRPGSVYWGAALSACGLLLAGLIYRFDRTNPGV
jgi:hypothetical protein